MRKHKIGINIPKHIAIIMDGNRRWAKNKELDLIKGHEEGVNALERVVEEAAKLGVQTLTVYALSTENIKERSKKEVWGLFNLMRKNYQSKLKKMMQNGVEVVVLGDSFGLPSSIKRIISEIRNVFIQSKKIRLNIALNYGSKLEIINAVKNIIEEKIPENKIDEKILSDYLYTKGQLDPELLVRTGGRKRLSNFLLWQCAYSEVYFTDTLWPDFNGEELKKAISWYQAQVRNFGR